MKKCSKCESQSADNARYCCGCGYELPKLTTAEVSSVSSESKKKNRKRKKEITGMITGGISFLVVALIMQFVFKPPSIDKMIMEAASEMNAMCPFMVDSITRLDNTIAMPPKTFQYNYTLGFLKDDIDDVELDAMKNDIESRAINHARTHPDMSELRNRKVSLRHSYKDFAGNYLFSITVTPEQYK